MLKAHTSFETRGLEEEVEDTLPHRHRGEFGLPAVDALPVVLTATAIDIDLVCAEPTFLLPEVATDPEDKDDREGEVGIEEIVRGTVLGVATKWSNSSPEL